VTELVRLLDSSASPSTRAILRAGLADAPKPDALRRVAAVLGVSAGALGVALPASAVLSSAAGAAATVGQVPAAAGASLAVLSKWLVTGALGGVLASGAVLVVERAGEHSEATRPAPAAARPESAPAAPPPRRPALNPVPETPEPAPAPSPQANAELAPPAVVPPGPSAADRLGAEAARIDAARRALARGDLRGAARELDAYQEQRSVGVLDREALLLRIQLLVRRGEHARAVIMAKSYLSTYPSDAHAKRLRALIDEGGKTWPGVEGIDR
jgi:hypothetical protein